MNVFKLLTFLLLLHMALAPKAARASKPSKSGSDSSGGESIAPDLPNHECQKFMGVEDGNAKAASIMGNFAFMMNMASIMPTPAAPLFAAAGEVTGFFQGQVSSKVADCTQRRLQKWIENNFVSKEYFEKWGTKLKMDIVDTFKKHSLIDLENLIGSVSNHYVQDAKVAEIDDIVTYVEKLENIISKIDATMLKMLTTLHPYLLKTKTEEKLHQIQYLYTISALIIRGNDFVTAMYRAVSEVYKRTQLNSNNNLYIDFAKTDKMRIGYVTILLWERTLVRMEAEYNLHRANIYNWKSNLDLYETDQSLTKSYDTPSITDKSMSYKHEGYWCFYCPFSLSKVTCDYSVTVKKDKWLCGFTDKTTGSSQKRLALSKAPDTTVTGVTTHTDKTDDFEKVFCGVGTGYQACGKWMCETELKTKMIEYSRKEQCSKKTAKFPRENAMMRSRFETDEMLWKLQMLTFASTSTGGSPLIEMKNKRCSNYQKDGTWTRKYKHVDTVADCGQECLKAGKCEMFSFNPTASTNNCQFNAPHKCIWEIDGNAIGWRLYHTTIVLDNSFEEERMPVKWNTVCNGSTQISADSIEDCGKKCIAKGFCNKFSYKKNGKKCAFTAPGKCKTKSPYYGWDTYDTASLPPKDIECVEGMGMAGGSKSPSNNNSVKACAQKCNESSTCIAFDYTTMSRGDSCRLYTVDKPRITDKNSGNTHNRKYCLKKGWNKYQMNARCSNENISGTWTRQWVTTIDEKECADKCVAAGTCNKFSFKDGVCLFNAPYECKVETGEWAKGWKTWTARIVVQDKKSTRRLDDYKLPYSKEAFDRIKDINFIWSHDQVHEMGCEMCRKYKPTSATGANAEQKCKQLCAWNEAEKEYTQEPIPVRKLGDSNYMSGARASTKTVYLSPCTEHGTGIDNHQIGTADALGVCMDDYDVENYDKLSQYDAQGSYNCGKYTTAAAIKKACDSDIECIGYTLWHGSPWCLKKGKNKVWVEVNHTYYRKITGKQKTEARPHHVSRRKLEEEELPEMTDEELEMIGELTEMTGGELPELTEEELPELTDEEFRKTLLQPHRERPDFSAEIDLEAMGLQTPEDDLEPMGLETPEVTESEESEESEESKENTVGSSLVEETGNKLSSKMFMLGVGGAVGSGILYKAYQSQNKNPEYQHLMEEVEI